MSHLIELNNIETILALGEKPIPFSSNKVVSDIMPGVKKAIIKLDAVSVCEVFGYQIALFIGINVPRMQGFWMPKATDSHMVGRVGILIEYFSDWENLYEDKAAKNDPLMTTRALTLRVFARDEWGEFGISNKKLYLVDLEQFLPIMIPSRLLSQSEKERTKELDGYANAYNEVGKEQIRQTLLGANSLGLLNDVEIELRKLCSLSPDNYTQFLRIDGHPLSNLLSRYSAHNFGNRLNSIAKWFDLPTHEIPKWR